MKTLRLAQATLMAVSFWLSGGTLSAGIVSTFGSGSEGWTGVDPTGDWTGSWKSTGGNPGGYMEGVETDPQGGVGYFISPNNATWTGDFSQYIGGTLSYDLKVFEGTASNYFADFADVTIYSGTNFVQWSSLPNSLFSSDWATHQITLDTTSFVPGSVGADFNLIMSNVTSIQIRGELISFAEREGLDNVMVTAAATPAPSTLVMSSILFGMFGVVWSYKRFKQTAVAA